MGLLISLRPPVTACIEELAGALDERRCGEDIGTSPDISLMTQG